MKKNFLFCVAGLLLGALILGGYFHIQGKKAAGERQALLDENARLRAELENAIPVLPAETMPAVVQKTQWITVTQHHDPRDIMIRLQQIRIAGGPEQTRNTRLAVQQFENLIATGTNAFEPIREFLLRNEEIDYESWISPRGSRDGRIATEFTVPPSLRFGLFDAVRQIGGVEAETILADTLATTGRGAEIAYLTRVLQELAPNKYRDAAVMAARELLSRPVIGTNNGLDRYDREYLYGVLAMYGDASYAGEAQAQLARADGTIDRGALRYLQQTLGQQALSFVAEMYRNPNVQGEQKEYLGRFALNYAGLNPQADELWRTSIFDKSISLEDRRDLIEDLNDDGFENRRQLTERDIQLARNRLALIARFQKDADEKTLPAFAEAQKDLQNMLERAAQPKQ